MRCRQIWKKADWYNLRGAAYRIMKMTGQQRSQIVIGGVQGWNVWSADLRAQNEVSRKHWKSLNWRLARWEKRRSWIISSVWEKKPQNWNPEYPIRRVFLYFFCQVSKLQTNFWVTWLPGKQYVAISDDRKQVGKAGLSWALIWVRLAAFNPQIFSKWMKIQHLAIKFAKQRGFPKRVRRSYSGAQTRHFIW